jgi:hypothetical protein
MRSESERRRDELELEAREIESRIHALQLKSATLHSDLEGLARKDRARRDALEQSRTELSRARNAD